MDKARALENKRFGSGVYLTLLGGIVRVSSGHRAIWRRDSQQSFSQTSGKIPARHALGNRAEDLVGNSARQVRMLRGGYFVTPGFAKDHDFVADSGFGYSGYVNQCQVHRDVADHRTLLAADQHAAATGKQAVEPIRISHRQHGKAHRRVGYIRGVVTETLFCSYFAQANDGRPPAQDRLYWQRLLLGLA